jgi:hypothetical protein
MAILEQQSVGDIIYYTIDAIPTHIAPKGSIAIYSDKSTIYRNNGSSSWIRLITKQDYCQPFFIDNLAGRDTAQNAWSNLNGLGWQFDYTKANNWGGSTGGARYVGLVPITASTFLTHTVEADDKWQDYELINALNNTVDIRYQGATGKATSRRVTITNNRVLGLVPGDYMNVGLRWTNRESGGGAASRAYIPTHASYTINKLNEVPYSSDLLFEETWESNSFTANSWTVVNDTVNQWVIGTADTNGGTYSVYVSNDGTSNSYTITAADVSHFYRDFTFPSTYDNLYLKFDWKCWGENAAAATQYDYGAIVMTTTATTPTAASEVSTTQATGGGDGRVGASTNLGKFNEGYEGEEDKWYSEIIDLSSYSGQTKRLVFTWVNDGTVGDDPPMMVDNIKLYGVNLL